MKFATKTIHAGRPSEPETGALVAPIFQTSTYEQDAPGHDKGFSYSRTNNPTRQRLETVLAALEGVDYCAAFASGLAAENAVLQAYLRPGDEVIIPRDVYGGTYRILNRVYQPIGIVTKQIDTGDLGAVEAALSPRTRFVWIETPTNPRLLITDIEAVSKLAHARKGSQVDGKSSPGDQTSLGDQRNCCPLISCIAFGSASRTRPPAVARDEPRSPSSAGSRLGAREPGC